tara:strand:+ start:17 stop:592 length:576 start_codon:yes stop_codon:yes gene_type:complete
MNILSIDVGIRNLAYVIIQVNDLDKHTILRWDVLELIEPHEIAAKVDNAKIGKSLYIQFDDVLKDQHIDKILIENQIGQNAIKMKTIQGMINMYFIMRNYELDSILNYNAVHKLKPFLKDQKSTYAERKKKSKEITHCLCKHYYGEEMLEFYCSYKKKDDLADCLLQALDFIRKKDQLSTMFYETIYNEIS